MSSEIARPAIPKRLANIPAFPPVAAKLLGLLAQEDADLGIAADLIATDPTFCARILQCANSVEFGLRSEVTSIRQALLLLGVARTREVTLTLATASYARVSMRRAGLRCCWQHTIACAILAEEIALTCSAFTDQAYTAGMIHDIGRLGLLVAYPEEYQRIIQNAAEKCIDILDYEREQFGVDHAEAGRWLAERWGLPESFRVFAGRHHDPTDGAEADLLTIVQVACRLADFLGYSVTQPLKPPSLDEILADLPPASADMLRDRAHYWPEKIERRLTASDDRTELPPPPDVPAMEVKEMDFALVPTSPVPEIAQRSVLWAIGMAALGLALALGVFSLWR